MRLSRHLLILTLLAAALCSDRDAALAQPTQPRATPTQGLIQRLSAQLRKVIRTRKLPVEPVATENVVAIRPRAITCDAARCIALQSWLLNLPPPTV